MANFDSKFGRQINLASGKMSTADTPSLSMRDLRSAGCFPGNGTQGILAGTISWPGNAIAQTVNWRISVPPKSPDAIGWIELTPTRSDHEGAMQRFGLRYAWNGWQVVNPADGGLLRRLFLNSELQFGSWQQLGLLHPSRQWSKEQRPIRHLQLLRARLAAAKPDSAKYHKIQAEITEAEQEALFGYAAMTRRRKPRPPGDPDPAEG